MDALSPSWIGSNANSQITPIVFLQTGMPVQMRESVLCVFSASSFPPRFNSFTLRMMRGHRVGISTTDQHEWMRGQLTRSRWTQTYLICAQRQWIMVTDGNGVRCQSHAYSSPLTETTRTRDSQQNYPLDRSAVGPSEAYKQCRS